MVIYLLKRLQPHQQIVGVGHAGWLEHGCYPNATEPIFTLRYRVDVHGDARAQTCLATLLAMNQNQPCTPNHARNPE